MHLLPASMRLLVADFEPDWSKAVVRRTVSDEA
jgi:hypothetical protein